MTSTTRLAGLLLVSLGACGVPEDPDPTASRPPAEVATAMNVKDETAILEGAKRPAAQIQTATFAVG